jgi:hypothetical protein
MSQTNHPTDRDGTWYYRRRVPVGLVQSFGKKVIQFSLGTTELSEAKKRRAAEDLKWTTRFETAQVKANGIGNGLNGPSGVIEAKQLSEHEVVRLVQQYVERMDEEARQLSLSDPPESEEQRAEIKSDIGLNLSILKNREDLRADQWICSAEKTILQGPASTIDDQTVPYAAFAEWVRRGLTRRAPSTNHHTPTKAGGGSGFRSYAYSWACARMRSAR